ncbi:helix-turn-helix domain-containing protein [Dysgonomonas sp. Marseille-P4677]|uniref:terminase gpP N-terminus-related DNA-binding protein n=1 Tax=Dysgonomonas sp. Marseille-P4677 TaxID=2364790 RepID=UPI001913EF3A|nr:helix-turn-helix domain-containing protein [Dysgonomonas sp. Marseille-P4677]MBK5719784.1 helix-turn-helix domain-containing protein [Dysgonomonas sp. Marseille-P4677]
MGRTPKQDTKKKNAKALFITGQYQQKEIAELVGVTVQTISRWVNSEKWDVELASLTITKEKQLARYYAQINEINEAISERDKGQRYANSKEADILNKLSAAAQKLESETGVRDIVDVSIGLLEWVRGFDVEKAKELSDLFDGYIKTKL